tara:strand:+ start:517 stop:726 length:210 start_codon:yes stop_codon:yes gene_type:complete
MYTVLVSRNEQQTGVTIAKDLDPDDVPREDLHRIYLCDTYTEALGTATHELVLLSRSKLWMEGLWRQWR